MDIPFSQQNNDRLICCTQKKCLFIVNMFYYCITLVHSLNFSPLSIIYIYFFLQAENIYNDEEPDTPASELEAASS